MLHLSCEKNANKQKEARFDPFFLKKVPWLDAHSSLLKMPVPVTKSKVVKLEANFGT